MRKNPGLAALCMAVALAAAGCVPGAPAGTPAATPSASSPASATATTPAVDLTQPGAAVAVLRQLVARSGSTQVIMVSLRAREASVTVLDGRQPHTWALRDGVIGEVRSDVEYIDQAAFDPDAFDLSDLGALFRAAAAVSGSAQKQELQIVDTQRVEHAPGDITMSVSTNPETRTVFFNADGTLVPTLDLNTAGGIAAALRDAIGTHRLVTALGVSAAQGAYAEFTGADGSTVRRRRLPKIAVIAEPHPASTKAAAFDPALVDPAVIWRVLTRADGFGPTAAWTLVAAVPPAGGEPRLAFTVGSASFVTDLAGIRVHA